MPEVEYRILVNNTTAQPEQLEKIDQITVEQEVDMAWECRLKIPIAADEQGNWTGDDEDFMQPFARLRVEVKIGNDHFKPLFDGPVTGFDTTMSAQPGQSVMTVIAQDDSFFLNRVEAVTVFEDKADHVVVIQVFGEYGEYIASTQIDNTPASGTALTPVVVQRGTAMDILRFLAKRQGKHVYVLPGDNPGESQGCFKSFPTSADGLPALVLLGAERNIDSFKVRYCACKPTDATASSLKITDKSIIEETARSCDSEALGDEGDDSAASYPAMQILPPSQGEAVDLGQAVSAAASASAYAYEAEGQILEETYSAVLQPYQIITLRAGNTPISGDYLITKLTHKLTREGYSQSFHLTRNARSTRFGSASPGGSGGIF